MRFDSRSEKEKKREREREDGDPKTWHDRYAAKRPLIFRVTYSKVGKVQKNKLPRENAYPNSGKIKIRFYK